MSTSSEEPSRLEELLGASRDGLLDAGQMGELDRLLTSDPEARRVYLEYIDLCVMLRHYQGTSIPKPRGENGRPRPARAVADPPQRPRGRESSPSLGRVLWLSALAASLGGAVYFGGRIRRQGGPPDPAPPAAPVPAVAQANAKAKPASAEARPQQPPPDRLRPGIGRNVAVLTRAIDPLWGSTDLPTAVGSALTAGRLRLKSGLIQLEFYGGAIVVLEGPADFELLTIDRALCRSGKLRVRAPLQSSHFSVMTPNTTVVDLGTEFGIQVHEAGPSEIQVFEGSVAVHDEPEGRDSAAGRQVIMGQGVRIDRSGAQSSIAVNPESFIGSRELEQRSSTEAGRRYRAWRAHQQKLQVDPRVLVYYTFEDQQPWERTLRDRATARKLGLDGSIVGSQWTEGRWPGKSALDFKRTSDRIRINIPGEFDALTLMSWIRVDDYDHRLNSLLLADGWGTPGEVHWELDGDGRVIFALSHARPLGNLIVKSPVVLGHAQLGLWTHLATVFAPLKGKVAVYANGREVASVPVPRHDRANIGWANIGNWSAPPPSDPAEVTVRNFNGRIDEFIVFDAPLEAQEIQAIYEVGKPAL